MSNPAHTHTHTYRGMSIGVCERIGLYVNLHRQKSHVKTCQSFPVKWVRVNSGCSCLCCILACGWTLDRLSGADGIRVQALESRSFLRLIHHSMLYYQTGNTLNTTAPELMEHSSADLCVSEHSHVMHEA